MPLGIRAADMLIAGVACLAMLSTDAALAQPQCRFPGPWTRLDTDAVRARGRDHLSPLRIAADPSVLHEAGRWRMWFTNANSRNRTGPAFAESADGIEWTVWRRPAAPDSLMDLAVTAAPSDWDGPGIETPDVLRAPTGEYRMYYTGNRLPEGSVTYAIGLATSPDGVTWQRFGDGPVLEPENDWEMPVCRDRRDPSSCVTGGVLEPSVLYDADENIYKMWYVGMGTKRDSFLAFRIGYATSPDGIRWTRHPDPVLDTGPSGAWDEIWVSHVDVLPDPAAGFHMFYFGSALADYEDGAEIQKGAIGHAYSPDGIAWERNPNNPILAPRRGEWDRWSVGGPNVVPLEGRFRMYYFGNRNSGLVSNIGIAEAPCGP